RAIEDDVLAGRVRCLCQPRPPGEHGFALILLDAQIPQGPGVLAHPDGIARRVEDEASDPGLVIGLRLPLRGEERFEAPVVVGELTGEIGRAHVWTPVTFRSRMPSSA